MYPTVDELVANGISDTNLWESLVDALDDAVFQIVMSFQR